MEVNSFMTSFFFPNRKEANKEPVALVVGQVPDLRELLVGLINQRPVSLVHWYTEAAAATVNMLLRLLLRHFFSTGSEIPLGAQ